MFAASPPLSKFAVEKCNKPCYYVLARFIKAFDTGHLAGVWVCVTICNCELIIFPFLEIVKLLFLISEISSYVPISDLVFWGNCKKRHIRTWFCAKKNF